MSGSPRDRALAAIFHELRTPLSIISGYAELLGTRDDDETRRTAAAAISSAAARLNDALRELDDVLRAEGDAGLRRLASRVPGGAEGKRRVLLVDDDESIRALLRMTLPVDDFTVLEARDGNDALEVARLEPPDIVLLDWRMPGLGGAGLLAELRRQRPLLPLVVLTAEADGRASAEAHELGASAFLTKPFSPLELLRTVDELLASAD